MAKSDANQYARCGVAEPIPPVVQTQFEGRHICAQRGGDPFEYVTRVDPLTLKCPSGTAPCSEATSPENTVCYPPKFHTKLCPITWMEFVQFEEIDKYRYEKYEDAVKSLSMFTIKPFILGVNFLVASKWKADSLPLVTTAVEL